MGEFSPWHLLIVAVVFVVLFGAKKLPDAARSIGRSMRILKAEVKTLHEDETPTATPPAPVATSAPVAPPPAIEATAQPVAAPAAPAAPAAQPAASQHSESV